MLGACSTFAADRAGIAVPPGLVHLKMTFFPLQFAFNFWSSFLKEDFPFRPSGNRGSGSFVSYPQSSMLFRQPRRSRGSKNARRGGGGKATHVSQPATRRAASRGRKRPRGGNLTNGVGEKRGESAIRTVQKGRPLGFPHQGHSCSRLESLEKARKSCLLELL